MCILLMVVNDIIEHRFLSVTDRFLNELAPVSHGQVAKDLDTRFAVCTDKSKPRCVDVWSSRHGNLIRWIGQACRRHLKKALISWNL